MLARVFVTIILCIGFIVMTTQFTDMFKCLQTNPIADSKIKTKFTLGLMACAIPFIIPQPFFVNANAIYLFFAFGGWHILRQKLPLQEEGTKSNSSNSESSSF